MIRKTQSGQALVLAAVALVALLGVMGLAIDMGVLRYDKRLQQTAADAAAIAGASDLPYNTAGSSAIISAAQYASASNGYTDTTGGGCATPSTDLAIGAVSVTVCNPPISGPHTGDTKYVEAYVSAGHPTFFMRILGDTRKTVTARAVATDVSGGEGSGCLYTLGAPTSSIEGVNVNGNPTLNAPTCGIVDNGNFNTKGNALVVTASTFGTSGDWSNDGTKPGDVTCTSQSGACPETGVPATGDPLSSLQPPCTSCSGGNTISISGGGDANCGTGCTYSSSDNTYSIAPGTYCSITINGVATDKVVFESGLYIIDGISSGCTTQSLNIPGNATISGTGVTFFFANSSTLNMTGTPTMNLSAPDPTTDPNNTYAGILFYQSPTDINTNGPSLGGNTGSNYEGALYFPSDNLTFYGNNNSFSVGMVITKSIQLSGNPYVNLEGSSDMPGGVSVIKNAVLVE